MTEERQKKYDFTNPYAYSHATLAVKEDSEIKILADLKGKKALKQFQVTMLKMLKN